MITFLLGTGLRDAEGVNKTHFQLNLWGYFQRGSTGEKATERKRSTLNVGSTTQQAGEADEEKWEKAGQFMLTPFPSASVTTAVTVHSWPLLLHSFHAGSYQWISRKLLDFNFGLRPSLPTSPPLRGFWHFGVGNYLTEQLLRSKVPQYIKFELTSNHISQSTHKKNPIYFSLSFEPVPLGIWIMQVAFRGWLFLVNVSRF